MNNKELESIKDVMLSNMKTQDIWFDISDGFVETLKEKDKEIERLKHREKELKYFNDILENQNIEKSKEIERLKQGYCELKEKCNKGECDCTHEEYNGMCEENIKMDLEIERLNGIINNLENELARVYEIELDYPIQFVKEEVEKVKLGVDKE